ncbi:MAG: NAD-dependent epimerase/dehydratase family protein, partial [Ornithinibacter sp.]
MKVLLVGATGRLGAAVGETLTGRGHQVVTVGRTAGDIRADVADPEQTARVFAEVGGLDAVASAAGDVPYERVVDMTPRGLPARLPRQGRRPDRAGPAGHAARRRARLVHPDCGCPEPGSHRHRQRGR